MPKVTLKRYHEIDILRALAVIGVVFNHTLDGVINAGLLSENSSIAEFNIWMYQFRMPVIAFVLGVFVPRAVAKYGNLNYIKQKIIFALYIYTIWYVIQIVAELLTSKVKNTPVTLEQAIQFWNAPAHLWFIPYIAVAAIFLTFAKPWNKPLLWLPIFLVLSTLLWGWNPEFIGSRGLSLLLFSAAGASIGTERFGKMVSENKVKFIFLGILCGILSVILQSRLSSVVFPGTTPVHEFKSLFQWEIFVSHLPSLLLATLGVFMLLGISCLLSNIPSISRALCYIGTRTINIYLAHVIIVAGMRIFLIKLGFTDLYFIIPILLLSGVLLPLLIEKLSKNNILRYIFEVPEFLLKKN